MITSSRNHWFKLLISLAVLPALPVWAAVLVEDTFNYSIGSVSGDNGGLGFSYPWGGNGTVVNPGLNYAGVSSGDNALSTTGSYRSVNAVYGGDTSTYYVSFLMSSAIGGTNDGSYAGIDFYRDGNKSFYFGEIYNTGYYGIYESSSYTNTQSLVAVTTGANFIVAKLQFTPTGDTFSLWINPATGSTLGAPDLVKTTTANLSFNLISLGSNTAATFDEFRLGTTYADVQSPTAPIPEPSRV